MKTIDLRREQVTLDELLRSVGDDEVRITSKDGVEFILEPSDAFERETAELGRSANFMAFLAERSAETGRRSLADIESELAGAESPGRASDAIEESEEVATFPRGGHAGSSAESAPDPLAPPRSGSE